MSVWEIQFFKKGRNCCTLITYNSCTYSNIPSKSILEPRLANKAQQKDGMKKNKQSLKSTTIR